MSTKVLHVSDDKRIGKLIPKGLPPITSRNRWRKMATLPEGCIFDIEVTHCYSYRAHKKGQKGEQVYRYSIGKMDEYQGSKIKQNLVEHYVTSSRLHYKDHDFFDPKISVMLCVRRLMIDREFWSTVADYSNLKDEIQENLNRHQMYLQLKYPEAVLEGRRCHDAAMATTMTCAHARHWFLKEHPMLAKQWEDQRLRVYQFCNPNEAKTISDQGLGMSIEELESFGIKPEPPVIVLPRVKQAPMASLMPPSRLQQERLPGPVDIHGPLFDVRDQPLLNHVNQAIKRLGPSSSFSVRQLADNMESVTPDFLANESSLRVLLGKYPKMFSKVPDSTPVRYSLTPAGLDNLEHRPALPHPPASAPSDPVDDVHGRA